MKLGIYYVESDCYDRQWIVDAYVEGYESNIGEVQVEEFYEGKRFSIYLLAVSPISAFVRGCNLILNKIEEVSNETD